MAEEETYDQGLRVLSDQEMKKLLNSVDDEVREKKSLMNLQDVLRIRKID